MAASFPDSYYAATRNSHIRFDRLQGEIETDVCVCGGGFTAATEPHAPTGDLEIGPYYFVMSKRFLFQIVCV